MYARCLYASLIAVATWKFKGGQVNLPTPDGMYKVDPLCTCSCPLLSVPWYMYSLVALPLIGGYMYWDLAGDQ